MIEINFAEEEIELDPCSCLNTSLSNAQQVSAYCVITNGCSDPAADNYCFGGDYLIIYQPDGEETCIYGAVEGCTCPAADNYNPEANMDDGSCTLSEGCSNPLADNYSLTGCGDVTITNENCLIPGCTCPDATFGYDPEATYDDGTCISTIPLCTNPNASNFNEGCDVEFTYLVSENCEDVETTCELDNIEWEYDITDANMTIQVGADVVLLNGEEPPTGSLLGVFFTNANNDLTCAGYLEWTGDQLAIAAWASESGLDNGLQAGEEIIWLLSVGNQTFVANNISMNNTGPFTETFTANGFGQLTAANYECEVTGVLGCTDPTAYNYNSSATLQLHLVI
jgi:hypothetical protein